VSGFNGATSREVFLRVGLGPTAITQ